MSGRSAVSETSPCFSFGFLPISPLFPNPPSTFNLPIWFEFHWISVRRSAYKTLISQAVTQIEGISARTISHNQCRFTLWLCGSSLRRCVNAFDCLQVASFLHWIWSILLKVILKVSIIGRTGVSPPSVLTVSKQKTFYCLHLHCPPFPGMHVEKSIF